MEQLIHSPSDLGKAIKRQRHAKKLNQNETGRAFKIEQSTVSSIEQGAPGTRLETLFRLLAALDLEMILRPKNDPINTRRTTNSKKDYLQKTKVAKKTINPKKTLVSKKTAANIKKSALHKIKVSW